MSWSSASIILVPLLAFGCSTHQRDVSHITREGLGESIYMKSVQAVATPPVGWVRDPLRKSEKHTHEVWRSPSGNTAYGVMHFWLPFPVGPNLALWGFLREMERKQGEATLLGQEDDPELPGIRFVAEGGPYKIRVNLVTRGWEGWAAYAGTLRDCPIEAKELDLARRAREYTTFGSGSRKQS